MGARNQSLTRLPCWSRMDGAHEALYGLRLESIHGAGMQGDLFKTDQQRSLFSEEAGFVVVRADPDAVATETSYQ